ncbi:hypothetical protein WBP07_15060 [Novosphingobium sp. BL-8A]|uniref:hypothetical protein n=1 Tax=Novosphingobium sp. BL-8A TaxID=3127639 RepID=UPI003757551F
MVDIFALVLSHGLLALAAWRLLLRPDLDVESAAPEKRKAEKRPKEGAREKEDHPGSGRAARRGMIWNRGTGEDA